MYAPVLSLCNAMYAGFCLCTCHTCRVLSLCACHTCRVLSLCNAMYERSIPCVLARPISSDNFYLYIGADDIIEYDKYKHLRFRWFILYLLNNKITAPGKVVNGLWYLRTFSQNDAMKSWISIRKTLRKCQTCGHNKRMETLSIWM